MWIADVTSIASSYATADLTLLVNTISTLEILSWAVGRCYFGYLAQWLILMCFKGYFFLLKENRSLKTRWNFDFIHCPASYRLHLGSQADITENR